MATNESQYLFNDKVSATTPAFFNFSIRGSSSQNTMYFINAVAQTTSVATITKECLLVMPSLFLARNTNKGKGGYRL
jgi:hypothetical protein